MAQYKDYNIEGRTAIVTGGGTGIGAATAIELAKAGAKLALFGRRLQPLEETRAECLKYGGDVMCLQVDVSDKASVTDGVAKTAAAYGGVDILVNNAGFDSPYQVGDMPFDTFFDMEPDEYMQFFKVHTLGHYLMMQACVEHMKKAHFGRIVNITSVTGVNGLYSSPAYTSSKAAAICQTKAFAKKYGKSNITVNSIAPGMVNTPMKTNSPPVEFEMVAKMTPLDHVAQPVEIARVALFFAQENLFVSGQNIIVDGGSTV